MKLTSERLSIPVVAAILLGLLGAGVAIAAFTAARSVSIAVDADSVKAGTTPSVTTSGDTASISFSAITLDSNRAVLGYELRRNGGSIITCASSPCQDQGLTPANYSYEVRGVYRNWRGSFSSASSSRTIAKPDLSFTSSSASCSGGSVTLPAGTTSWTSKVSRSYAASIASTSVSVSKTGSGSLSGSPLTINANATESGSGITLSGLANGNTATVTASATDTNSALCAVTVATPAATTSITLTQCVDDGANNKATCTGTYTGSVSSITITWKKSGSTDVTQTKSVSGGTFSIQSQNGLDTGTWTATATSGSTTSNSVSVTIA